MTVSPEILAFSLSRTLPPMRAPAHGGLEHLKQGSLRTPQTAVNSSDSHCETRFSYVAVRFSMSMSSSSSGSPYLPSKSALNSRCTPSGDVSDLACALRGEYLMICALMNALLF